MDFVAEALTLQPPAGEIDAVATHSPGMEMSSCLEVIWGLNSSYPQP